MVIAGGSDEKGNETIIEEKSDELVPKRSIIWQWFGFQKDVKQNAVICKRCRKVIAAKGSNTTNVFHHLKSHPLQNEECFQFTMSTPPHTPKKTLNQPKRKSAARVLHISKRKYIPVANKCDLLPNNYGSMDQQQSLESVRK